MNIIKKTKEINKEYHYFNNILDKAQFGEGRLEGVAVSFKDCICVKGVESRAGSRILSGYNPVFDATVVEKVKQQGGAVIGKTIQDSFGFGSFATNVGLGMKIPLNPFDKDRVCGGSSGGSAGITQKADFRHISIAESTGGSIVCPASFCGVYGLCPTYGLVSRYGLMDYANSMDKIGPMAKSVKDIALALNVISGYDPKDSTSVQHTEEYSVSDFSGKIGIIEKTFSQGVTPKISEKVSKSVESFDPEKIKLPLNSNYSLSTYYILAMCEASTNLARYCGMRYGKHEKLQGNFNEYFTKVRSKHFNAEAKRRIIIGTFARMAGYRNAYYIKATKVRTKLISEYKEAFKKYDILVSPTMPILPPRFDEIEKLTPLQNYMMDIFTTGPNIAGLPHINIPIGFVNNLPVGLLAVADHFQEQKLINFAEALK